MAINFPGPYELRIAYTDTGLTNPVIQHTQRLNTSLVEPAAQGDVFGNYLINDKNGATSTSLAQVVEDYLTVFNALFDTSMTIDSVELWKYPDAQSFDAVFWSSYSPTANVGTTAGAGQPASQNIYSFRSSEGGTMKVETHEGLQPPGPPEAYAVMEADQQAYVDYILDGDGVNYSAPFLARDTSYPFSFNRMFPGQNEKTWRKRNGR